MRCETRFNRVIFDAVSIKVQEKLQTLAQRKETGLFFLYSISLTLSATFFCQVDWTLCDMTIHQLTKTH